MRFDDTPNSTLATFVSHVTPLSVAVCGGTPQTDKGDNQGIEILAVTSVPVKTSNDVFLA